MHRFEVSLVELPWPHRSGHLLPFCGRGKQAARMLILSLPTHTHTHTLSSSSLLSHTPKAWRRQGEGKEKDWRPPSAARSHGSYLGAANHKELG